ncbi:MAG: TonB-dependent receptor [Pseudomonadales bacterium]
MNKSKQLHSTARTPLFKAVQASRFRTTSSAIALSALVGGSVALLPAQAGAQMLEEVVVTATKREVSMQDVPMSIQAFDSTALEQLGITEFDDYTLLLPSVSYQTTGPGNNTIYMRGASDGGSGDASGAQPSVAMYLDEQPVTAIGRNLDIHLYDIQRVEALAGPQGTLFGANSQAGTLRIITNKPNYEEMEGGIDLGAAATEDGDPSYSVEGFINVPLGESAAVRIVAWDKKDGGYIDNIAGTRTYLQFPGGFVTEDNDHLVKENFNEKETSGLRAALQGDLGENWTGTLTYLAQKQETEGVWFHDPNNPNGEVGDLEVQRFNPDNSNDEFQQFAAIIEGDLGFADLIYAGSYMDRDVQYANDYSQYMDYYTTTWGGYYACDYYNSPEGIDEDCTSLNMYYEDDNNYKRNTHELRLQSTTDSAFQYVVGAYYETSSHRYVQKWHQPGMAHGSEFESHGEPDLWYLTDQLREDDQKAIFGELSYSFTDSLTALIGLRKFWNENSVEGRTGYGIDSFLGSYPIVDDKFETDQSDTIIKANLTWNVTDDAMLYVTYSEGYRPGGINRSANDIVPRLYKPDFLENYEFGWKTTWMDNRLRWNGAIYRMDWADMQFSKFDASYGLPVTVTINITEAEITGLESDLTMMITDNWSLSLSGAWTDSVTASELEIGTNNSPSGTRLPYVPEFKGNLSTRYEFDMGELNPYVQFTYAHVGETYNDIFVYTKGSPNDDQRTTNASYDIVNLSGGIQNEKWGVDLYVRNLTDERAEINSGGYDENGIFTNRPRTLGVNVKFRF